MHDAGDMSLQRVAGHVWWRVDAYVTPDGAIDIVSGDGNEWHAIVRGEHDKALLLRCLRRTGDLTASIGATRDQEILARLFETFHRGSDHAYGPYEEIKAFLNVNGITWEAQFWADDGAGAEHRFTNDLDVILSATRLLLAKPQNDFSWSSWPDGEAALAEFDAIAVSVRAGEESAIDALRLLFSVAGPIQEVSLASGWADRWLSQMLSI